MPALIGVLFGAALLVPFISFAASVECYCVTALRTIQGVDLPRGNANRLKPNLPTNELEAGDVLIFRYPQNRPPYNGHVALTLSRSSTTARVVEYNYHHCQKSYRTVSLNDKTVLGVYRPTAKEAPKIAPTQSIA